MDLKEVSQMSQEKKERVGILMPPSQVAEIDTLYPLHGHASRSDFVCKAVEFYIGSRKTQRKNRRWSRRSRL